MAQSSERIAAAQKAFGEARELSGLSEEAFITGLARLTGLEVAEALEFGEAGAKVLVAAAMLAGVTVGGLLHEPPFGVAIVDLKRQVRDAEEKVRVELATQPPYEDAVRAMAQKGYPALGEVV